MTIQDSHSGGLLSVAMPLYSRYGIVPRAPLEDPRLSLDTQAVATGLATQDTGFQICGCQVYCRLNFSRSLGLRERRFGSVPVEPHLVW